MSLRDVLPRAMARHNGKLRHFTASAANLPQQGDLPFSIEELHAHDLQIETTVIITTVSICEYDAKSPLQSQPGRIISQQDSRLNATHSS